MGNTIIANSIKGDGENLLNMLYAFLKGEGYGVSLISEDSIKLCDEAGFILCELSQLSEVSCQKFVIVGSDFKKEELPIISKHTEIWLIHPDTENSFENFEHGAHVISCGFGTKSTIAVASDEDKRLSLSLQRAIPTVKGKIAEPAEFIVEYSGDKNTAILIASTAISLRVGIFENKINIMRAK